MTKQYIFSRPQTVNDIVQKQLSVLIKRRKNVLFSFGRLHLEQPGDENPTRLRDISIYIHKTIVRDDSLSYVIQCKIPDKIYYCQ